MEDRLARLEAVVVELVAGIKGLAIRSDRHEGTLLELKFRDRLPSDLGRCLRRAKVLQPADLLDDVEASLESAEADDFLRAVGLVAFEAVYPQTVAYAREQGVRVWADGMLLDERPSRDGQGLRGLSPPHGIAGSSHHGGGDQAEGARFGNG